MKKFIQKVYNLKTSDLSFCIYYMGQKWLKNVVKVNLFLNKNEQIMNKEGDGRKNAE